MSRFNSGWLLAGVMILAIGNGLISGKKVSAAGSSNSTKAAYTSLLTKAVRCALPKYQEYAADNIRFNGSDISAEYHITRAFQILFDANGRCVLKREVPQDSPSPHERPPISNILTTNDGVNHLFLIEKGTTGHGEYRALMEDFNRIPAS